MCWPDESASDKNKENIIWTRNFVALNCESVKAGVTNNKEMTKYRSTHDILKPAHNVRKKPAESTKPYMDITHGVVNR